MRNERRGTTLIEVAIASAILAIMVALVMTIMFGASDSAGNTARTNRLGANGRIALDRLRMELSTARVMAVGMPFTATTDATTGHTSIRYRIPVGVAPDGTQQYGSIHQDPNIPFVNGYYEVIFVGDTVYRETNGPLMGANPPNVPATIQQIQLNSDLNGDGDTNDSFVRGQLVLRIFDSVGAQVRQSLLDDYVILAPRPGDPTMLDGDLWSNAAGTVQPAFRILDELGVPVNNPMISAASRKVRVNLWHAELDENGRRLLKVNNREEVRLDNPQ